MAELAMGYGHGPWKKRHGSECVKWADELGLYGAYFIPQQEEKTDMKIYSTNPAEKLLQQKYDALTERAETQASYVRSNSEALKITQTQYDNSLETFNNIQLERLAIEQSLAKLGAAPAYEKDPLEI